MACRGCANLQCSCFTIDSETSTTTGNGSQYAPYTFRPSDVPFPRPFGHLMGTADQTFAVGGTYTEFGATTPDIDLGGNMRDTDRLVARADGIHLVGFSVPFLGTNAGDINDAFSLRRNAIQVSTGTFAHNTSVSNGQILFMSTVTILDLNTGDILDVFVQRVAGAGSAAVEFTSLGVVPRIWATWMGGPI